MLCLRISWSKIKWLNIYQILDTRSMFGMVLGPSMLLFDPSTDISQPRKVDDCIAKHKQLVYIKHAPLHTWECAIKSLAAKAGHIVDSVWEHSNHPEWFYTCTERLCFPRYHRNALMAWYVCRLADDDRQQQTADKDTWKENSIKRTTVLTINAHSRLLNCTTHCLFQNKKYTGFLI